jgi:hypothetical protein
VKRSDYDGDGPPDLSRELEAADKIILDQDKEIERLREQLAECRALLREACEASCFDGFDGEWYGNQIEDEWFQRAKEVAKDE